MNEGAVGCLVVTCIFAMIGAFAIGISAFVKVNQLEVELQELQRAGSVSLMTGLLLLQLKVVVAARWLV